MAAENEYFESTAPPKALDAIGSRVEEFVSKHMDAKRKVVLVTSGGTTVPLEANTVRFIDNFSAGTRGATSTEYFLEAGYAVIFLHRQFSLQPYSRHYTHSKNCFLDYMSLAEDGRICVTPEYAVTMKEVLTKYKHVKENGLLQMIEFVTVSDYLFLLRRITQVLSKVGTEAMFYLAAAAEHKIQSGDGALQLTLDQVPKIIKPLVKEWAPKAFVVSFKLETDPNILQAKSQRALDRYGHQVVIGNILNTRKHIVYLLAATSPEPQTISIPPTSTIEIESLIIPELVKRHEGYIEQASQSS